MTLHSDKLSIKKDRCNTLENQVNLKFLGSSVLQVGATDGCCKQNKPFHQDLTNIPSKHNCAIPFNGPKRPGYYKLMKPSTAHPQLRFQ